MRLGAIGDVLELAIAADSFLRHMVRTLVGTMVEKDPDEIARLLQGRPRAEGRLDGSPVGALPRAGRLLSRGACGGPREGSVRGTSASDSRMRSASGQLEAARDVVRDGHAEDPSRLRCPYSVRRVFDGDRLARLDVEGLERTDVEVGSWLGDGRVALGSVEGMPPLGQGEAIKEHSVTHSVVALVTTAIWMRAPVLRPRSLRSLGAAPPARRARGAAGAPRRARTSGRGAVGELLEMPDGVVSPYRANRR